ncbi:hypothetical protein Nit79A3_2988 [Nitrosomonas sp. Is79A3]|uniref:toxin-antitoxin system TumE family protein n=1 Tax=Nitrosomonas sp. (strain Is79A3) TaxID=261292 RepID=UPI000215C97D
MKSTELLRQRIVLAENKFAELVLWRLTQPLAESEHTFKYRLAYVVNGECVLRYDNEAGKGDHRHWGEKETEYTFSTPEKLLADFQYDIERWNYENSDS